MKLRSRACFELRLMTLVMMRARWTLVLISLAFVACGWLGAQTLIRVDQDLRLIRVDQDLRLIRVDQDLRVIYAEYTLAATDLGHVSGELIRYRTSVIRAIEADRKEDFERIMTSLPRIRARLNNAMDRFIQAANDTSLERTMDARELTEPKSFKDKLKRI